MNMPFTLKKSIQVHGYRYGITVYQNYRRFLFFACLRNLRQRLARWIFPEYEMACRESVLYAQDDWVAKVQDLQRENARLYSQIQSMNTKMQTNLRVSKLGKAFSYTDEQLRATNQWSVQQKEEGCWEVVTGYCSLGGCDLYEIPVHSEREGLLLGSLMTMFDYQPQSGVCSSCYSEYMQSCI